MTDSEFYYTIQGILAFVRDYGSLDEILLQFTIALSHDAHCSLDQKVSPIEEALAIMERRVLPSDELVLQLRTLCTEYDVSLSQGFTSVLLQQILNDLVDLEANFALNVLRCRARDDTRGDEIFGAEYFKVHVSSEEDSVVQFTRKQAEETKDAVKKLTETFFS